MIKYITIFFFTVMGWRIHGKIPSDIKKCVMIAAPHTSNWDYIYSLAACYKLKLPIRLLIKKDWVDVFLIGSLIKRAGGIGVDRSQKLNLVDSLADLISKPTEDVMLMIPPEGTRKLVEQWKTGFYYVALKAKVPIVLSFLDYKKRIAGIGPHFMPTGNFEKDMQILKDFYKDISPKFPEKFCLDIY